MSAPNSPSLGGSRDYSMVFSSDSNEGESHLILLVTIQQINGKPLSVGMFTEIITGKIV